MANYTNRDCEICDEIKPCLVHYGNMWTCDECWAKEQESTTKHMSPEAQQARVDAGEIYYKERDAYLKGLHTGNPIEAAIPINSVLRESAMIDNSIQVRTDLFNAATKAIIELKEAIDNDPNITNKAFTLASTLKDRFEHHKTVVFELNQKLIEEGNRQKAIQVYLNTLSNQLRAEEREKLKIADINYRPAPPKVSKPKTITTHTTKKTKIDKSALRKAAADLGVSEFTINMLVVSQNLTIEQAVDKLKNLAKS
jgi:hypothetical protein